MSTLDALMHCCDGLASDASRRHLGEGRDRLARGHFNLVVLGEFKRGKSTLINALVGENVLPTGVVPLTSAPTVVRHGPTARLIVHFLDGHREQHAVDELVLYASEVENPGNRRDIELAVVEWPSELLAGGLQLVDTPGIDSVHRHNTEVTREFLPRVDAAICVLGADQPLSVSEHDFFTAAAARIPRLLLVVNKIDQLAPDDRAVALGFVEREATGLSTGTPPEVLAVSARERIGVDALRARILELTETERHDLLVRSIRGLAQSVAAEAAATARLEARAIELPLTELRRRVEHFAQRADALRTACAEAGDLLDRGIRRSLETKVNQPLLEHAANEAPGLEAELARRVEELGGRSPRALAPELAGWVDATVRSHFAAVVPRYEEAIAAELAQLERRYAERVERILGDVQAAANDAFGTDVATGLPQTGLRTPSNFTFKLHDVAHALDEIVDLGRTLVPGALGRRLLVRDARERLLQMTDRHAGRLRSQLVERTLEAVAAYQRELAALIEEAIERIEQAVERAGEQQRRGEREAQTRLRELERKGRECERLARELEVEPAATEGTA